AWEVAQPSCCQYPGKVKSKSQSKCRSLSDRHLLCDTNELIMHLYGIIHKQKPVGAWLMSSEIALNCTLNADSIPASGEPRLVYLLVDMGSGQNAAPLEA